MKIFVVVALSEGEPQKSLKLAQSTLRDVEASNQNSLSNRDEIIANLHSCIGNALLDLKKPTKALKHHNKDLEISTKKYALSILYFYFSVLNFISNQIYISFAVRDVVFYLILSLS